MSFTFRANNGKEYTYPNVGQRDGFVAEYGSLKWSNIRGESFKYVDTQMKTKLMLPCFNAAKNSNFLPFRTGNLRNSIRVKATMTGFELYIDDSLDGAPYQYFLEFGTRISRKHVGFWNTKIFNDVVKEILRITKGTIIEKG